MMHLNIYMGDCERNTFVLESIFYFLLAWNDGKIRAFTPETGRLMYVIEHAHSMGVTAVATTSDCKRIISGGGEGQVMCCEVSWVYSADITSIFFFNHFFIQYKVLFEPLQRERTSVPAGANYNIVIFHE